MSEGVFIVLHELLHFAVSSKIEPWADDDDDDDDDDLNLYR